LAAEHFDAATAILIGGYLYVNPYKLGHA